MLRNRWGASLHTGAAPSPLYLPLVHRRNRIFDTLHKLHLLVSERSLLSLPLMLASLCLATVSSPPANVQVAIVGGGMGGLAACAALRQRGIDAHDFEAAPTLMRGSTGTGIMISANGWSALEAIDP